MTSEFRPLPPHLVEEVPDELRRAWGWDLPPTKKRRRQLARIFVALENIYWMRLERMAHARGQTMGELIKQFDAQPRAPEETLPARLRRAALENAEEESEELWKRLLAAKREKQNGSAEG